MFPRLSSRLSNLFSSSVRNRGQSYYLSRAVHIHRGSAVSLDARVLGSQAYDVEIRWTKDELSFYCSCPFFDTEGPCKHLWATILAATARGFLSAVTLNPNPVELYFGDSAGQLDDPDDPDDPLLFDLPPPRTRTVAHQLPSWKVQVQGIGQDPAKASGTREGWPAKRQILYLVELAATVAAGELVIAVCTRDRKKDGQYGRIAPAGFQRSLIPDLPLAEDREIISAMAGSSQHFGFSGYSSAYLGTIASSNVIPYPLAETLLPRLVRTGRCFLRSNPASESLAPLSWDEGGPWHFELEVRAGDRPRRGAKPGWLLTGILRRADQTLDLSAPALVTKGHLVVDGMVSPLAQDDSSRWLTHLRRSGGILAPAAAADELVATLLALPSLPNLQLPAPLRYEEVIVPPRPGLRIRTSNPRGTPQCHAEPFFEYEGRHVPALETARGFFDPASRRFLRRDPEAEQAALDQLAALGVKLRKATYYQPEPVWELTPSKVPRVVRELVEAGWALDADGKTFRRPGASRLEISTGIDWFELHGAVEYGEASAPLPALLEALQRGDNIVALDDGTYGLLPEDWMRRIGMFAGMGTPSDGHIRFRRSQAGLLDALLATQPEARVDRQFARIREELGGFRGVEPAPQPAGFVGQLRDYQRVGLGWMEFLRRLSFGGCLADDMGVGKTAQVLALLEHRRQPRKAGPPPLPSLAVVPRSLIFNWKEEAARFTPGLRVLDYTGLNRGGADFSSYDLVLTTYGTLRREITRLKDVEFDYVVLDEAQAVKNAQTDSAKAVRLLRGAHRLALSGTPVENHLGELWSLFEFLNPGMLGAASVLKLSGAAGRSVDEDTRQLLSQALRPFILRRTKEQVARELPSKTEQTIYCELAPAQRKLYDELRDHYRDSLLQRIETQGLAKSKIMVLEALLRLRQAACHPGLIDPKRATEPSAKLEALLAQLREVLDAGHKALVFSQFTSLLKLLRGHLDREGVSYAYLDGKTRDRKACVDHFQTEAECRLFLISLKAGGQGLNLTAAEYVFLLDPWWNPAVEAQAVDRAHRIGQTRPVFAYRLIAAGTVEEKVLDLQKTKRQLADAIIGEDNALIRNLRREDLELLLS